MRRLLPLTFGIAVAACSSTADRQEPPSAAGPIATRAAALDAAIDDRGVQVKAEPDRLLLVLPEAAIFSRGEPIWLLEEGAETLRLLAETLKSLGGEVLVVGHTDDTGTPAYAQDLSERQAQAVVDALIEGGVSARRLRSYGMGGQAPLVPNDSPRDRSRNRRVEVVAEAGG